MKVPRDVSGAELIKSLCRDWDYQMVNQEGSHVILQTNTPGHQRLSVPNHKPLRIGTLNAILKTVAAHKRVDRQALLDSLR
ncbi:MAG TPA: type II toxin-antitoxin system HicA family toxin [Verrucomicrobiae bacterium]|jgi:predicted RNA binding protein YcfA (HicA-like mRNA interferase family)|nr:type II toxin-antitoxin system HicA family toxin [Verrucomicrobiae bacterium]